MYTIPAFVVAWIIFLLALVAVQGTDILDALLTSPK